VSADSAFGFANAESADTTLGIPDNFPGGCMYRPTAPVCENVDRCVGVRHDAAPTELVAQFGRRLAEYALEIRSDSAEARHAWADSDFETRRALGLAPDSESVKRLRDEVATLLRLRFSIPSPK
jgi:hypothetical protein